MATPRCRSVLVAALVVASLPAQGGVQDVSRRAEQIGEITDPKTKEELLELERQAMAAQPIVSETQPVAPEKVDLTPRVGLQQFLSAIVMPRPRRIAPGQTGMVHIVLSLMQSAVIEVGGHLQLTFDDAQGALQFGQWTLEAPKEGQLRTKFRGQPVYDNTAVIMLPVTVPAGTRFGLLPAKFRLEADISDGGTGMVRGRYYMDIEGRVDVGQPIPTPIPTVSARRDAGSSARERVVAESSAGSADSEPRDAPGTASRERARVTADEHDTPVGDPASDAAGDASPGELPSQPDPGMGWIAYAGGGLLLLVLILLIARRRP